MLKQAETKIQELEQRLQTSSREDESATSMSGVLEGDLLRLHDDNLALQSAVASFSAALANEAADGAAALLEVEVRQEEIAMYSRQVADLTRHVEKLRTITVSEILTLGIVSGISCCLHM